VKAPLYNLFLSLS